MKCPSCLALNAPDDEVCGSCGRSLDRAGRTERAEAAEKLRSTPGWAFFFAAMCGIIPVVTLGGLIPVGVGVAGVSACLAVGRATSLPAILRVLFSILIVGACWIGTLVFLGALLKALKR
jgi:hypothetical protein